MKAIAIIFVAALSGWFGTAMAAERPADMAQAFKDLPGVAAPTINPKPDADCKVVTRHARKMGEVEFYGDVGMPYLVYQCEKDGVVYESTRPPLSKDWYPGVNPRNIP